MNKTSTKQRAKRHVVEIGDLAKRRLDKLAKASGETRKAVLGELLRVADEQRLAERRRTKEWGEVLP